jgi:pyruvyltransferase
MVRGIEMASSPFLRLRRLASKPREIKSSLVSSVKVTCSSDANTLCAYWYESKNWGDALNPTLIRLLSGKKPIAVGKDTWNVHQRPIYAVIGSILDRSDLNKFIKNTIIWGPGFVSESGRLAGAPAKICAVRGPLSRDIIIRQKMDCPEIYGDPALLYPRFYRPEKEIKCRLGIIPHYVDKSSKALKNLAGSPEVKIIDIERPINDVVDQVCSCKYIASSSLHGIIVADAYQIPSAWIKFSENIVGKGFKFRDYFASVGRSDVKPLTITETSTIDDIYGSFDNYKIDIDLNALLEACPFRRSSR